MLESLRISDGNQANSTEISDISRAVNELAVALGYALPPYNGLINMLEAMAKKFEQTMSSVKFNAIMELLKFQTVSERFESITKAEESTFSWLLDGSSADQNPNQEAVHVQAKERLQTWIKEDEGFFYVSGKPGPGKSTLMKLICSHPSFVQQATEWAADSCLVAGRFFFWKPGHAEQKSILGLLRGLLYSMLENRPEITKIAFLELWDDFSPKRVGAAVLEHSDVGNAFNNVLKAASKTGDYKVILMIDGLDEFDGDHAILLELMQSWVSLYPSTIKICVSSREYGIFEGFFLESPKMRLHELTRGDMLELITSRLRPNDFFSSLTEEEQDRTKQLITERAEGVFLWVVMVVATLDDGILSGSITNARELQKSIEDCPTEMDDLLPHLLSSVSVHNRPWAYKAISLVKYAQFKVPEILQSTKTAPGVVLMDIVLLDEASPTWNLAAFQPRSEIKSADLSSRVEAARLKVLGCCKGFLNVITISEASSWPANGGMRMYVAVTHRSVVEFLNSGRAEGAMAQYLTHFNPFLALFSTMLACLRFLEPSNYPLLREPLELGKRNGLKLRDVLAPSLLERWVEFIHCALLTGQSSSPRFFSILDEVGDAIKRHLVLQLTIQKIRLSPAKASPHQVLSMMTLESRIPEYSAWRRGPCVRDNVRGSMSVGLFQAFHRIIRYFQLDDYEYPAPEQSRSGASLSNKPVGWIKWTGSNKTPAISESSFIQLLKDFFERGIDLNLSYPDAMPIGWDGPQTSSRGPWSCWQAILWAMLLGEVPFSDKYSQIIDSLVRNKADCDLKIFSVAPLEEVRMERLKPQGGWVLLVPFADDNSVYDGLRDPAAETTSHLETQYGRIPALLIRDSAPIYSLVKSKNWQLTVRDVITLWFRNDGGHFQRLFDALDQGALADKHKMPPSPTEFIAADVGILGDVRGSCDLEIYLEEQRVAMGARGEAATIRRNVKVGAS
ncbi:hypothetical protein NLG97_g6692 [Lecanicillium saksenae]|uniref:Uncharacterized protein n=1 Tax=Lecanicillium saksenae TaxID=468837 RepID=A0ACC1QQ78_9HYPO|nr:hypothetical protein NLG97_g6692 [Lecanicillium saksenae]